MYLMIYFYKHMCNRSRRKYSLIYIEDYVINTKNSADFLPIGVSVTSKT